MRTKRVGRGLRERTAMLLVIVGLGAYVLVAASAAVYSLVAIFQPVARAIAK